ncbi:hypothetical protein BDV19DRAFT_156179 [Aspergillus venezuelensis]
MNQRSNEGGCLIRSSRTDIHSENRRIQEKKTQSYAVVCTNVVFLRMVAGAFGSVSGMTRILWSLHRLSFEDPQDLFLCSITSIFFFISSATFPPRFFFYFYFFFYFFFPICLI